MSEFERGSDMNWLEYKWRVFKLKFELKKITAPFDKIYEEAKRTDPDNPGNMHIHDEVEDSMYRFDEEIQRLHTEYLYGKAWQLDIPFPYKTIPHEYWRQTEPSYSIVLSRAGKHALRELIRAESRARREPFLAWAGWLVGILGAVTGLVAVLKS